MPATESLRVLVVDDDRDTLDNMADLLSLHGHEVELTGGGKEALVRGPPFRPDICLIDLAMPDLDGLSLARQLRQRPGFVDTPFFCISAYSDQSHRDQATAAGFTGYLAKPVSIDQLLTTLVKARASVARAKELAAEHHRVIEQSHQSMAATARAVEEASCTLEAIQRVHVNLRGGS